MAQENPSTSIMTLFYLGKHRALNKNIEYNTLRLEGLTIKSERMHTMITISLCMIVKNEEDTISHCLESVKDIVDEINIVDTGSTDKTKEILSIFTNRIFDFQWVDDFAKARNYSFQQATKDYILWLDADDVILESDQKKLLKLKETISEDVDSVMMNYHLATDEFGNVTSKLKRNRLVKRSRNFQWIGAVHEYLQVWGNCINSDVAVTHKSIHHDSNRNILIYEKKIARGGEFTPRDMYYYANELKDHQRYKEAIEYYEKFLRTKRGWVEDNIGACGKMADCHRELGDYDSELICILRSFQYDRPRPEMCCRLGFFFMNNNDYQSAIFWYQTALDYEQIENKGGVVNYMHFTWLPHLQLCVCYDRIGKSELAYHHNEMARKYRPNDERILHNKKYFEKVLGSHEKKKV